MDIFHSYDILLLTRTDIAFYKIQKKGLHLQIV
jgi:hypothetical protein